MAGGAVALRLTRYPVRVGQMSGLESKTNNNSTVVVINNAYDKLLGRVDKRYLKLEKERERERYRMAKQVEVDAGLPLMSYYRCECNAGTQATILCTCIFPSTIFWFVSVFPAPGCC